MEQVGNCWVEIFIKMRQIFLTVSERTLSEKKKK